MDFEDLMCITDDEIEGGICDVARQFGIDVRPDRAIRHKAEIREDLTVHFHGCFPYHDGDEDTPCYSVGCDYGCTHCPMKESASIVEYDPVSDEVYDMVAALIKAIKMDANYEPTETEIKEAVGIIVR